ncbi:MAG: histidine kinase, CheA [Pseudomonadota bacterium]|jgi:two-component system chemotaxis sensor kinase CheA
MTQQDDDDILAAAREGFLDEAAEMLHSFEQALLVMETDPGDHENLNAAFRAAHTIKGTAGLFGYDAVVRFTHEVETLLEALRAGELGMSEALIAVLLQSRDQMADLLDEVSSGHCDATVAARSGALGAELRRLIAPAGATTATAAGTTAPAAVAHGTMLATPAGTDWQISLRFGGDALRNGLDPLSFIRYLDTLGQVRRIELVTPALPALEALDAEHCYLGVEIRFSSDAQQQDIEQVFDFVRDDCEIAITPLGAPEQVVEAPTVSDKAVAIAAAETTAPSRTEPERRTGQRDRRSDDSRVMRVSADKLDRLIDLIGELVIASSGAQLVAQRESSPPFAEAALRIATLVEEARDEALGLRMVPIGETFARFQRVVRDVSKQLGKEVELQITGGDTELDKAMVETIADPLMHLVRNSLDHGVELPADRLAAGKPATGRLALHAYHESGSVLIEVSDDGRGLNRDRILAKAIERELIPASSELSDDEIYQLIFLPGFSTAEQVTNLSGRGVGMDVVKRNVESLRGQIRVASTPGRGALMQIRLPLTLAIIDGFLTSVGGVSYVLPLDMVAECLEVPPECAEHPELIAGHFDLRGEVLPYLDIGRFYRHTPPASGRRSLVLVRDGASRIGLIVDRLLGEHQTVIKPLGQVFEHIRGLAGSTILGSGEVALILDVPGLVAQVIALRGRSSHTAH